jgi:hypothetical protein
MLLKKSLSADINDRIPDGSGRRGPHVINLCSVNFWLKSELDDMDNFSHFGDSIM